MDAALGRVLTVVPILWFWVASSAWGQPPESLQPRPGEQWGTLTEDGAWCWFSDPRAIRYKGAFDRTYAGWASSDGSLIVGAIDAATGRVETHLLHPKLSVDDHISPSLLILPDGRLAVFYSRHSQDEWMYVAVSRQPEDITSWDGPRELRLHEEVKGGERLGRFCYSNPALLLKEGDHIYLFWRGLGNKPTMSISDDLTASWTQGRLVVQPGTTYSGQRPYMKVAGDGQARIHLAFTDGHPRNEPTNGISYACYEEGEFRRADGSRIASLGELPFDNRAADMVYDARATQVRAWVWDVSPDAEGRPVIVYTRLPAEDDHRYHYASFDGERWIDHEVARAGRWFPRTPSGKTEPEPHYSGGIVLDHGDPRTIYLSVPREGRFEVERWTTVDRGGTWTKKAVTRGSAQDNIRPVAVRGSKGGEGPRVIWMNLDRYVHYTDYRASLRMDVPAAGTTKATGE